MNQPLVTLTRGYVTSLGKGYPRLVSFFWKTLGPRIQEHGSTRGKKVATHNVESLPPLGPNAPPPGSQTSTILSFLSAGGNGEVASSESGNLVF